MNCNEVFSLESVLPGYVRAETNAALLVQERPFDARCIAEQDGHILSIYVPAQGMRAGRWAQMIFLVCGIATFMFLLQIEERGFTVFAIIAGVAGVAILTAMIWSAFSTQIVHLNDDGMSTLSRCGPFSRTRWIERSQIRYARPQFFRANSDTDTLLPELPVEIVCSNGSYVLPTDSLNEHVWLIQLINTNLDRRQGIPAEPPQTSS